jgi:xylulokinase
MAYLLGIDIGTSTAKAVLFDSDTAQTVAISKGHEYPIHKPQPDFAEQNPDDWWNAVIAAVQDVVQQAGQVEYAAISFCGQMHGGVLLDAQKQPVYPAIIWADQRSSHEVQHLVDTFGADEFPAITGTLPSVGFFAPTLLWLKTHRPEILAQAQHLLLPKDYIALKMTGEIHSEATDAVATALFDTRGGDWSWEIIQKMGLPEHIFPPIVASSAVVGELTSSAANELGLKAGIPVVAGSADQPAQIFGNGIVQPGKALVNVGSGGQVVVLCDSMPQTDKRLHIFNHAVPGQWYILGAILSAGLSLRWVRDVTGLHGNADAYPILSREASATPAGAEGLLFLPYLSGERTPHMNPQAKGVFFGLSYHHARGHLARAVMEGVTFAMRQVLHISLELGGKVETVIASGGAVESDVWRQIMADIFGLPLYQTLLTEKASVGAALLAGVGVGVYRDFAEACRPMMQYGRITEPNSEHQALYQVRYEQFLRLYPLLQSEMEYNEKR